jgi:hypothetical protein
MLAQNLKLEDIQKQAFPDAPPLGETTLGGIIGKVLPYIFAGAGIALLVYLILGGLQLMTSQGDPKAIEAAKGKITNALIGFIIIVIAFFVVQIFGQIFGLQSNFTFSQLFGIKY